MRGHDDLAMADVFHLPHQFQKFDLARGQQADSVHEDEDTLPLAAFVEEAQGTPPWEWERKSGGVPPASPVRG